MSRTVANVYFEDRVVGMLTERAAGLISFKYAAEWIKTNGFAISHSLPLQDRLYEVEAQNFFGNLLPEGDVRVEIASQHGVSAGNDFQLLVAIGGECAGALTIGEKPAPLASDYLQLDLKDLERRFAQGETLLSSYQDLDDDHTGDDVGDIRLSLAGAQDKLPVYISGQGVYLPRGNSPTTHILKFPSRRFPYLAENETLMNNFGTAMGLEVAPTRLLKLSGVSICVVDRYDRFIENSVLRRAHQEDFCQALNFSYRAKYEKEGGPDFSACYSCLEQTSSRLPEDLERLTRWLIFNVIIGNCDAHAKNISMVLSKSGEWQLSPHYDLVSTKVYPRISKELAMSIGATRDSGTVTGTHWAQLAKSVRLGTQFVRQLVEEMALEANSVFERVIENHVKAYGGSPIIQPLKKVIHEQSRRLNSQLAK